MAGGLLLPTLGTSADVRLPDLESQLVDPFHISSAKAVVVLFVSADCPISNRYAPEVRRLHDTFAPLGVVFWLVYPNPAESVERIRDHVRAFDYPGGVLRDPRHALVKVAQATVTPEVAVFDARRQLSYRGRIDNRYVDFGLDRPAPTTHDLENALNAMLAGKPVPEPITKAVGCFLADFQ